MCSDEPVQIDQIDSFDDLSGLTSTFDPLERQGNMLNAQSTLTELAEVQTSTEFPKTPFTLPTIETPLWPSIFSGMSTKASTITTKNTVTTTKNSVATGAMFTLDNRNALNTDEEDSSLHEDPESQASAEENSKWWIWPLFCVSVGTILRKSIYLF